MGRQGAGSASDSRVDAGGADREWCNPRLLSPMLSRCPALAARRHCRCEPREGLWGSTCWPSTWPRARRAAIRSPDHRNTGRCDTTLRQLTMLRTALRNVLAHRTRLIMTVLAVCLGVAFTTGSLVLADSTTAAYRAAMSRDDADIAVSVAPAYRPGSSGDEQYGALDDALVREPSTVPGVASVRTDRSSRSAWWVWCAPTRMPPIAAARHIHAMLWTRAAVPSGRATKITAWSRPGRLPACRVPARRRARCACCGWRSRCSPSCTPME